MMGELEFGTPEHFRAWLQGRPDDKSVGAARDACDCPIAEYYEEEFGKPVMVWPMLSHVNIEGPPGTIETVPMQPWMQSFGMALDNAYPVGHPVSREEAIALLDALDKVRVAFSPAPAKA